VSEDTQGHERFMRRCIELAREAKQQDNTPVGSGVVLVGEITGEGMEQLPTSLLLTGHAEALACQHAVEKTGSRFLRGATLYSTAEPCFVCSYIIRQAEISNVICAIETPLIGGAASAFPVLTNIELNAWKPAVFAIGGVLAEEVLQFRRA
jgi:tRNA(adenine34) deaminase